MADKKLTEVDESASMEDTDKIVGNIGSTVKQISLTNFVKMLKEKIGLSDYQVKTDENLTTTSKEIVGAINENKEWIGKLSEEKVTNPSTATVGQVLSVKTVDTNGKPTEYEAVEQPTGGSSYTLPIASPTQLGGVKPVTKTEEMTQEVGVDELGGLFTLAGGGSEEPRLLDLLFELEIEEPVKLIEVSTLKGTEKILYIDVIIPYSEENSSGNIWVALRSNGGKAFAQNKKIRNTEGYTYFSMLVLKLYENVWNVLVRSDENWSDTFNGFGNAIKNLNYVRGNSMNSAMINNFTTMYIGSYINNFFPSGTKIKVYGK